MNTISACAITTAVSVMAVTGETAESMGPSLIQNAGFEQGETGWKFSQVYGESAHGITTDEKHSGKQCAFTSNRAERHRGDHRQRPGAEGR